MTAPMLLEARMWLMYSKLFRGDIMANYILNMGGSDGSAKYDTVDVFNVTKNRVEEVTDLGLSLSVARDHVAVASAGNYVLALGGSISDGTTDVVDIFKAAENSVEHILDHGLSLSVPRRSLVAAAAANYILAMGGYDGKNYKDTVDVFKVTESGVEAVPNHGLSLSVARSTLAGVASGEYILAVGGNDGTASAAVDVFKVTENGVEAVPNHGLSLSVARRQLEAVSCGEYILVMGGLTSGSPSYSNAVDVFKVTENGVEAVPNHGLALSVPRRSLAAATCGNYILAMGGVSGNNVYSNAVDIFKVTENGVEQITNYEVTLTSPSGYLTAATAGNYVLAMGGRDSTNYLSTIDIFQIN